ncbi:MAG: hypothetical protein GX354_02190 [Firmicutes bacterium]|jgi:type I restriction enzyme M protein|nr:hypothetical protein [Bacillota bacterium]
MNREASDFSPGSRHDLSINRYKEIEYEEVEYEEPKVILECIRALESQVLRGLNELENMLYE